MNEETPKYAISIAAELVGMHPQTLRVYETRGLVRPKRTRGGRRLYSDSDIARLRGVQALTTALGLSLAGVEHVLELARAIQVLATRVRELEARLAQERREHARELAGARREGRADVVIWQAPSNLPDR